MTDLIFNINKTCAVTGHRKVNDDLDLENLKEVFIKQINNGYDTFLIGMALGFDTICFEILYSLKKEYDIKLIACVPCENQSRGFPLEDKNKYFKMLDVANEVIFVSKDYNRWCMFKRNRFMVDNSSLLVAYLREDKGGTKNTVEYAERKKIEIIYV